VSIEGIHLGESEQFAQLLALCEAKPYAVVLPALVEVLSSILLLACGPDVAKERAMALPPLMCECIDGFANRIAQRAKAGLN
jgi:hypothetical protein